MVGNPEVGNAEYKVQTTEFISHVEKGLQSGRAKGPIWGRG